MLALRLLGDVRVSRSERQGIPCLEITFGDYLESWEIQEIRERILKRVAESRFKPQVLIPGARRTNMVILMEERSRDI